jgi:5S rRNA maturation endonuclease (ribonuclease M5)
MKPPRILRSVESVRSFIRKLNDESSNGALVVVEGPRDARALRALGFQGDLTTLSKNGGIVRLAGMAAQYRRTILLFDLDQEGRSLTKKAARMLEGKNNAIDLFFRRALVAATKGGIRQVEELGRFTEYVERYP